MIDPTEHEQTAMIAGGKMGGEYLEAIGKTDLAALSNAEWLTFLEAVVTGYHDTLRELAAKEDEIPF